ncbi:MAG: hypothetical protein KatS3mg038_3585 [Candidatus Kapaibacterium sp.]|nr:MAG: hypothetical protein KatS3mg038_3585 [Candidatus Kapabacteria bacterium]
MRRRDFLRTATALATSAAATSIAGIPVRASSPILSLPPRVMESDNVLIIIQLFGGNDALNTVIPAEDDEYYRIRPTLAIPKQQAWRWLTTDLYLHPALAGDGVWGGGFGGLMDQGRLAIVQDVGYDNPNLSHFRSTDIWLSGINSSDPFVRLSEGWIGRFFARVLPDFPAVLPEHPLCVQIGGTLSLLFQSAKGDVGIALTDPQKFFELGKGSTPDEEPLPEVDTFAREFNYIRSIATQADRYSQAVLDAYSRGRTTVDYGSRGLPAQLGMIARLISGGLKTKVYLCYLGGFDTHVQQQEADDVTKGVHPSLLGQLASGVAMFMQDALQQGFARRVVGITISEFGRRPYENGSRGTDHGAAGVQFVFGDGESIRSSRFGTAPNLRELDANGDLIYQNDYRRLYADILLNWFDATPEDAAAILGDRIAPLNVIKRRVTSSILPADGARSALAVVPNPIVGVGGEVRVQLRRLASVQVEIYNLRGQFISELYRGLLPEGTSRLSLPVLQAGTYLVQLRCNDALVQTTFTVAR